MRVGAAPCHPPPDAMVPYMGWPVWRGERDGAVRMCTFFRTYMLFRTYLYVFLFHSRQYQWRHQLKMLFRASQTIHFAVKHSLSARVSFLINFANFQQTEWLFFRTPNYAVIFFPFRCCISRYTETSFHSFPWRVCYAVVQYMKLWVGNWKQFWVWINCKAQHSSLEHLNKFQRLLLYIYIYKSSDKELAARCFYSEFHVETIVRKR